MRDLPVTTENVVSVLTRKASTSTTAPLLFPFSYAEHPYRTVDRSILYIYYSLPV